MSFVDQRCALAEGITPDPNDPNNPNNPDENYPPIPGQPDVDEYPSMDEIKANLLNLEGLTVLVMAVSKEFLPSYETYCVHDRVVGIFSAFGKTKSGKNFLDRDGRSERFYNPFYHRCNVAMLEKAGPIVKVMTDNGKAPGRYNCDYFEGHEYKILSENKNVKDIYLIDATATYIERLYHGPGSDIDFDEPEEVLSPQPQTSGALGKLKDAAIPIAVGGAVGWGASASGLVDSIGSAIAKTPVWKFFFPDKDDHELDKSYPEVKSDIINLPIGALPPPVYKPVSGDEQSIPTTDNTPSLQGTSSTGETSSTESAMGGSSGDELETDGSTQKDDKIALNGNSDSSNLFQRRRRGLRRRSSDQCNPWMVDLSDYVVAQEQSQAAAGTRPPAINSAPPQLDGVLPNVLKDSSSLATVQVKQHAKSDGIYPLDISILKDGAMINNLLNQRVPPGTEIEVAVPWDTNLPDNQPLIAGPGTHPLDVSTGVHDDDPLTFGYDDVAVAGPTDLSLGLKFDSNDAKHTHGCTVGAWSNGERDVECSFTVFHPQS